VISTNDALVCASSQPSCGAACPSSRSAPRNLQRGADMDPLNQHHTERRGGIFRAGGRERNKDRDGLVPQLSISEPFAIGESRNGPSPDLFLRHPTSDHSTFDCSDINTPAIQGFRKSSECNGVRPGFHRNELPFGSPPSSVCGEQCRRRADFICEEQTTNATSIIHIAASLLCSIPL
jgi:hypothetical protein